MPLDDCVQVEHLRLQHLLPAERQQLPRQRCRAAAGRCGSRSTSRRAGVATVRLRQDAARCSPMMAVSRLLKSCAMPPAKPADRFHLLRLAQLLLELHSIRDVKGDADCVR